MQSRLLDSRPDTSSGAIGLTVPMIRIARVAIDSPAAQQSADGLFDYLASDTDAVGRLAIVPFGRRTVVGLIVEITRTPAIDAERLKRTVATVAAISPFTDEWLRLNRFAARYYHRTLGEVALPALPGPLRKPDAYVLSTGPGATERASAVKSTEASLPSIERAARRDARAASRVAVDSTSDRTPALDLNADQTAALESIERRWSTASHRAPLLLHGVTGSGKTAVYLRLVAEAIARGEQALILVPEINLTPQLAETVAHHLPRARVATLHSGHAEGQRLHQWWLAHEGHVDVLLGTRLAVLASLPRLGLIVVDEEHDSSYKQHEGLRYSARDLAVARARDGRDGRSIPIVLASATPSIETWAQVERGRYDKVTLPRRAIASASLPTIRLVPSLGVEIEHGLTQPVRTAIADRIARREPVLVFHNRRGYAPVVACGACGWTSACPRCSVNAVFHKTDRLFHCHHCGWQARVPRACPVCGNSDLAALGRGTQRVEESLRLSFPDARVERIDRDSTRRKGSAAALLDAVHRGDIDVLVGTQMLAKGHDFRNVSLVCVLDADSALFSHDFRAGERLFANLMQVAGRAGRGDAAGHAEVLIQTRAPEHPLFAALVAHDFDRFAASQLDERRDAGLPPFSHQAIVRAEARSGHEALAALGTARALGEEVAHRLDDRGALVIYDPVPMTIARIAHVERAQLLVEARARRTLHAFLDAWLNRLRGERLGARWHVEVDPAEI